MNTRTQLFVFGEKIDQQILEVLASVFFDIFFLNKNMGYSELKNIPQL